jgi:flagellar hook-length control protein FliK
MKISSTRTDSSTRDTVHDDSTGRDNDRFARLLDSKRHDELNSSSQQHSDAADIPGQFPLEASSATQTGDSAVVQPAVDIQRLVDEIVQQISRQNAGSAQNIEIQFQSTVLNGLRVQLQSQGTGLSVNFYTHSEEVGAALKGHFDELSKALKSKGFRPERLNVSLTRAPSSSFTRSA